MKSLSLVLALALALTGCAGEFGFNPAGAFLGGYAT